MTLENRKHYNNIAFFDKSLYRDFFETLDA